MSAPFGALASPKKGHNGGQRAPIDLNIHNVTLGDIAFKTWYPSFYPEELTGKECKMLYVCQSCFKYTREAHQYSSHRNLCTYQEDGPPGERIYAKDALAIYEIDGEEHQLFAQNLSLFAKLFLDNKSVFFDVVSFNYYLMVHRPSPRNTQTARVIGFFSKEKMSWDNNNVACILVFPPWQRKGLGKVLMGISYELSRREGRYGGPEKPLSDLGRRGYMQFWEARIARTVLNLRGRKTMTVDELAKESWILSEDVVATLKRMGIVGDRRKDGSMSITKRSVKEWAIASGTDLTNLVDDEAFSETWIERNGVH